MATGLSRCVVRGSAILGGLGALLGLLLSSGPQSMNAQQSGGYPKPPADIKTEWVGASICANCHDQDPEQPFKKEYQETRGFDFVRLCENKVWGTHDMHSHAYKSLLTADSAKNVPDAKPNPTAQRIEDNFRRTQRGGNYMVAADVHCLACHASVQHPIEVVPPEQWTSKSFEPGITEGVGCEMCHGHGSRYRDEHQRNKVDKLKAPAGAIRYVFWREEATPADKHTWGLVNLRDPAIATHRCASCHVGNKREGRFITHEMYAAGHPPLPPLDLMAYAREQPRHWGLPAEMPYLVSLAAKNPDKSWAVFHYRGGEQAATRRFAESSIANLKASLALIGQLASDAQKAKASLDFAAFDCYSCHHDLKYPSDRQARGYDGPPGRPLFRLAPFALARLVVEHAAETDGGKEPFKDELKNLDAIHKELAFSFGPHTFGNPDAILKVTEKVNRWCASALENLKKVTYTREETKRLLAKVIEAARREPLADSRAVPTLGRPVADPEVAQLYHWATRTLTLDLLPTQSAKPPELPKRPTVPTSLVQLRSDLNSIVVTRLRTNADFDFEEPAIRDAKETIQPVHERIGKRLEVFNNFRAEAFREAFKKFKPPD